MSKPSKMSVKSKRLIKICVIFAIIIILSVAAVLTFVYISSTRNNDNIVYKPIADVIKKAPKALDKEYDNLKLPKDLSIGKIDKLQKVSIKWTHVFDKQQTVDTISQLSATVNKDPIAEEDLVIAALYNGASKGYVARYFPLEEDYENPDDPNAYFCMVVDGYNFELTNFYWIQHICGFGTREKWYSADSSELADVVCKVDGQDYSAKQALDYANTVTEKYKDYYKEFDVVPKYVIVSKNDFNDEYSFVVKYAYMYNGVEISTTGSSEALRDEVFQNASLEVRIASPDKMMSIVSELRANEVTYSDLNDNFVTLSSALDHTSKILAKEFMQNISEIDIVYVGRQEPCRLYVHRQRRGRKRKCYRNYRRNGQNRRR